MTRQVLTAQQHELGPEHPDNLRSLRNLSDRLAQLGQVQEAADMARQVLTARQRVLGPEHPDTLGSLVNLSNRLADLWQLQEAADTARQVLTAQQQELGPEHPEQLKKPQHQARGAGSASGGSRHGTPGAGGAAACA